MFKVMLNKYRSGILALMPHNKVLQIVVKERVLFEPVIIVSHKVQCILLHADFMNTWLL